jgi:hypothetical protein
MPPLALFDREPRIPRLCNRRAEHIQDTDILFFAGQAAELLKEPLGILPSEDCDRSDAQRLEITDHGGTNGNQIEKFPAIFFRGLGVRSLHGPSIRGHELRRNVRSMITSVLWP